MKGKGTVTKLVPVDWAKVPSFSFPTLADKAKHKETQLQVVCDSNDRPTSFPLASKNSEGVNTCLQQVAA